MMCHFHAYVPFSCTSFSLFTSTIGSKYVWGGDAKSCKRHVFSEFDDEYFILCGDFNLALNPSQDTYNYCRVNNP